MSRTPPRAARGRYPAAPEPYPGEAPSAWVSRVAHAHDLTIAEIVQLQGYSASEFDAGYGDDIIAHIATGAPTRSWPAACEVVDGLREVGLLPAKAPKVQAEDWWAYCPDCVSGEASGEAPRLLALWCQPLAYVCLEHAVYLRPWPRGREARLVDGTTGLQPLTPEQLRAESATDGDLDFGRLLLSPGHADWEAMARAVFDLVDALMTRTGVQGQHPPLLTELLNLGRSGDLVGSVRLAAGALWGLPAATRLLALRYLSALTRTPPLADDPPVWLRQLARRPGTPRQRSLNGASCDELFLLIAKLNAEAAAQLARRASGWPPHLRIRLGAAIVVGSLANLA